MGSIVRDVCRELGAGPPLATVPEALAREARLLHPTSPHERHAVLRPEAAELVDRLLVRVARGRGALDVGLGERLALLADGDAALRLGYSGIGDYARERLGIAARPAQDLARLARGLRDRALLRDAVRSGEVTSRKAQAILPVARGEAEASWVARAKEETVRALAAGVKAATGGEPEDDERWERISVDLTPAARATVDEAMALAGKLLGATAPKWQRLEAICQEYLAAHPAQSGSDRPAEDELLHSPVRQWLDAAKAALEEETRWAFLEAAEPVAAPAAPESADARTVDAELRRLAHMRERWDELVGHLAMLLREIGLWHDLKFASFGHDCEERLGLATRTVEQRIRLERRLYALPGLREAMTAGRVSYEKARLVAEVADEASVAGWIERAEKTTCIALGREIDALEDAQMCARGELAVRVTEQVATLLGEAFRAARAAEGRWLNPGGCLEVIARHFIATWKEALSERSTPHRRVLARDRGLCTMPGCSRAADHAHHIRPRAQGGSDDPTNLSSLCAPHHLHCVHRGYVRVSGQAPDALCWN